MASEADMPEWGSQEERGIDMEVETAAAVLASGSNAVILKHPTVCCNDFKIDQSTGLMRGQEEKFTMALKGIGYF